MNGIPAGAMSIMTRRAPAAEGDDSPDPSQPLGIDPLLITKMFASAKLQSDAAAQKTAESEVDKQASLPPPEFHVKMHTAADGSTIPLVTAKNLAPQPDQEAVHAASEKPYADVSAGLANAQIAKGLEAIQNIIGSLRPPGDADFSSGSYGSGYRASRELGGNPVQALVDGIRVRLGLISPKRVQQQVDRKRATEQADAIKEFLPIINSGLAEQKMAAQEQRTQQGHQIAVQNEFERFTAPENMVKFPDAGTALRAAQNEFGNDPDKLALVSKAFDLAGQKHRTELTQKRGQIISSVKPEDTAMYSSPEEFIADKEDPDNPFNYGEKARLSSRFKAAQQQWQNLTLKEKQDRQLEGERIAVQRASVAAAEHANRIQEATLNASKLGQTGEAAIANLPADVQSTVRGIAEGRLDIGKITSMRGGNREAVANLVSLYDPTWSTATAPARAATYRDFTSGSTANKITAINTAIHHLDTLSDAAEQLKNASPQLWNRIANHGLTAVAGDPRVTKFTEAANAVSAELAKSYGGGEATDSARNAWQSSFSSINSPKQLRGAVETAVSLLGGASAAIKDRYERGMGKSGTSFNVLSNESRRVLQKNRIDPNKVENPGGSAAPAAGAAGGQKVISLDDALARIGKKK